MYNCCICDKQNLTSRLKCKRCTHYSCNECRYYGLWPYAGVELPYGAASFPHAPENEEVRPRVPKPVVLTCEPRVEIKRSERPRVTLAEAEVERNIWWGAVKEGEGGVGVVVGVVVDGVEMQESLCARTKTAVKPGILLLMKRPRIVNSWMLPHTRVRALSTRGSRRRRRRRLPVHRATLGGAITTITVLPQFKLQPPTPQPWENGGSLLLPDVEQTARSWSCDLWDELQLVDGA